MTATRSRKEHKRYAHHQKHIERPSDGCVFCQLSDKDPQVIRQTKYFKLVQNIFPYTLWDSQVVADHLVVIPQEHTDTLASLPAEAAQEFVKLISDYEADGYNVYARAPGSAMKSIVHQHTHLIKLSGRKIRFLLYFRRPYRRVLVK